MWPTESMLLEHLWRTGVPGPDRVGGVHVGGQCASGVCEAGKCTCAGDICKGVCRVACASTVAARNPDTCACCRTNGQTCIDGTCNCCCSGTCSGPVGQKPCVGLPDGAGCSFDAQCESGSCELVPAGGNFLVYQCV